MKLRASIPNFLTCLNLLSGSIALVLSLDGYLHIAAFLVILASVFDFADGLSARLLKAYSMMGKELDSLADLVSFGLVPSVIIYKYMLSEAPDWGILISSYNVLPFFAFTITIFSALRLAKFNIDQRQSEKFLGLPTPANAIFIISLPIAMQFGNNNHFFFTLFSNLTENFWLLLLLSLVSSALLVSELPLFSLKFKNISFHKNKIRYVFLSGSFFLFLFFGIFGLPLIIIYYILLSIAGNLKGID
jgi:CDP-diacylglycerol--serine O-phosphatidyltransferase